MMSGVPTHNKTSRTIAFRLLSVRASFTTTLPLMSWISVQLPGISASANDCMKPEMDHALMHPPSVGPPDMTGVWQGLFPLLQLLLHILPKRLHHLKRILITNFTNSNQRPEAVSVGLSMGQQRPMRIQTFRPRKHNCVLHPPHQCRVMYEATCCHSSRTSAIPCSNCLCHKGLFIRNLCCGFHMCRIFLRLIWLV